MKIAIVTGASSGIGKEFVNQIEKSEDALDEIWVIARRKERLLELQKQLKTRLRIISGDLLQIEFLRELQDKLRQIKPEIQILVNAAGFGKIGKVEELACEEQLEMIDLNCNALTHMCKLCIPFMKSGSRIINLASAAAFCPQPSFSVYAASKSYVLSFSRSLGTELESRKIKVTSVCPGPVATEFFEVAGKKEKNGIKEAVMAKPEAVVKKALRDAKRGKAVSVYGASMKFSKIASRLIPHSVILKVMKHVW